MSKAISLVRIPSPEDIKQRALQLCREHLCGEWNNITENELILHRIDGGFTNQLYYCGLPNYVETANEPKEIALRLFGKKHFNPTEIPNERFSDFLIDVLASDNNLGPKVYGIFDDGEIEEYVKSHEFRIKEQTDDRYVQQLAQKLAHFHSLDVPIPKHTNWYENFLHNYYTKACQLFQIQLAKEANAVTLLSTDLTSEINWLKTCIKEINSPIVFSHNDFRPPNILVREDGDDQNLVTLCDFEYSCYYYRGFDFGSYFCEWGRPNNNVEAPFPDDKPIKRFIKYYREECAKIHGNDYLKKPENSVSQILRETKLFTLCEHMFVLIFILRVETFPKGLTKLDFMAGAEKRLKQYIKAKELFILQKAIPL